jgi:hypothetical protein
VLAWNNVGKRRKRCEGTELSVEEGRKEQENATDGLRLGGFPPSREGGT